MGYLQSMKNIVKDMVTSTKIYGFLCRLKNKGEINPGIVVMAVVFCGGRIIDMLGANNCRVYVGYVRGISWSFLSRLV